MIIDASAVIAVLHGEPEEKLFAEAIDQASVARMSAANYLEAAIVVDSKRVPEAARRFDEFIEAAGVTIEPVTVEQAEIARAAYRDFGRGSGHPARLNFGDCFAYALATSAREPLLYKGDDFGHTDVRAAV